MADDWKVCTMEVLRNEKIYYHPQGRYIRYHDNTDREGIAGGIYDLAVKTNRSRNELICMALQYAIENMELKEALEEALEEAGKES